MKCLSATTNAASRWPGSRWVAPWAVPGPAAKARRTGHRTPRLALLSIAVLAAACSRETPKRAQQQQQPQQYAPARAAYFHGDLPDAVRQAALGAAQNPSTDSALYWQFRLLEAEALLDQGNKQQALPLIAGPVPPPLDQLEVRRLIDSAQSDRGDASIALPLLARAEKQVTDEELRIQIHHLRGIVLYTSSKGDLHPAEASVRKALDLANQSREPWATYYAARALVSLGHFKKTQSQYSAAIDLGERGLEISRKIGADKIIATALLNLGYVYSFLGDARGLEDEQNAAEIFGRIHDEPNLIKALGETGLVLYTAGNSKEAIPWYKRALDLAKNDYADDRKRISGNLALAYEDLRQWDEAERWNRLAGPHENDAYVLMNEADIALQHGNRDQFFNLCKDVIRHASTYGIRWRVHGAMAHAYADQANFKMAFIEYRRAMDLFEKARSEQQEGPFRITFLSRLISLFQGYADALVRDHRPDEALQITELSRARVLEDREGKSVKPQRRPLAANTVILSFWIAPGRSHLWLINRDGPHHFELPAEDLIINAVADYTATMQARQNPLTFRSESASPLWGMLLEQAAPLIPIHSRVVVVPDGPLHQLNLETVVVPGTPSRPPHYWLEDVELVVAPSISLAPSFAVTAKKARPLEGPKMLLIGAPDYAGTKYLPLQYAKVEIKEIRARFPNPPPKVYEGPDATPQAYLSGHPEEYAMIHFAAHADANQQQPLESAVILSHSGEENRLYAKDILKTPIHADLVTVSACRSAGVKAFAGEGLIGFAWAFLASGAKNVIGGLWNVGDESTSQLMSALYAGIAAGMDPVAALQNAKMKLMKDYPKPYFWGPFQIYSASK